MIPKSWYTIDNGKDQMRGNMFLKIHCSRMHEWRTLGISLESYKWMDCRFKFMWTEAVEIFLEGITVVNSLTMRKFEKFSIMNCVVDETNSLSLKRGWRSSPKNIENIWGKGVTLETYFQTRNFWKRNICYLLMPV